MRWSSSERSLLSVLPSQRLSVSFNGTFLGNGSDDSDFWNGSAWNRSRAETEPDLEGAESAGDNWWGLLAVMLVVATAAGNILVCLAISWERRLQNVTNYFLMSLAITDLMVAVLVMPLGILNLVRVGPPGTTAPEASSEPKEGKGNNESEDPKKALLETESSTQESDGVSLLSDSLDETKIGPETRCKTKQPESDALKDKTETQLSIFDKSKVDLEQIIDAITKKKSTNLRDRERMKELIEKMGKEYKRVENDLVTTLTALNKIGGVANRAPPKSSKAGAPSDKAGSSNTREGAVSPPLASGTGNPKGGTAEGQSTAVILHTGRPPTAPMPPPKAPTHELEVQGPQGPGQARERPELMLRGLVSFFLNTSNVED
ncbi:unnamed protein product [Bemisia tabaci]|uniref:G-protein coupled receptors family 1 profile domain-containing protein n=1 Tax=Bemisia tabaci TaxID=7038 RepID=A0A9P0AM41_BEMTA|nr:unnamed protein product [Bemisia tabaci]